MKLAPLNIGSIMVEVFVCYQNKKVVLSMVKCIKKHKELSLKQEISHHNFQLTPSNAESTFVISTRTQRFLKTI